MSCNYNHEMSTQASSRTDTFSMQHEGKAQRPYIPYDTCLEGNKVRLSAKKRMASLSRGLATERTSS